MKLRVLLTLFLAVSITGATVWYITAAIPSPTRSPIQEPGTGSPCSYRMYIDVTAYVAQDCRTGQNVYLGTGAAVVTNNALNAISAAGGGKLFMESGNYIYTAAIVVPSYVEIEGDTVGYVGTAGVTLTLNYAGNLIEQIGTVPAHKVGIRLSNLYLNGNGRSFEGSAVFLSFVSNVIIENVYIINFKGSALSINNAFNGFVQNIKTDNNGYATTSKPSIFLGGATEGVADFTLNGIANSLCQWICLYLDIYATEIKISNYDDDPSSTPEGALYQHIYLLGHRLQFVNIDLRSGKTGVNIIDDQSYQSSWANVHIGNVLGTGYSRGAAGTSTLTNFYFRGVNGTTGKMNNAVYVPLGVVYISNAYYDNVITPLSSPGSGIIYNATYNGV